MAADRFDSPNAFVSYSSDDADLAGRIAKSLQASGIEVWWDKWCIGPGESLRQKIDEGLSNCTHFLVLLTPNSIGKPWVNQEIDAALIRMLEEKCKLLPVRYQLPASDLPPLLSGMHAPEISADEDITVLIANIHGISRKPPLGPAPQPITQSRETNTGYSPAANAVARLFVERSAHGEFADPQFSLEALGGETGLSTPDLKDGLHELSYFFKGQSPHFMVTPSLFTEFDEYWKSWQPAEDAVRLAADIANDTELPSNCQQIANRYGWEPRRLNPAITYLLDRDVIVDYKALGTRPFVIARVVGKKDEVRRFLKARF